MTAAANHDRTAALLAAYGADPARWPVEAREHAMPHAAHDDAAALDAWLDAAPVPPAPSLALRSAILAAAAREPHATRAPAITFLASLAALWRDLGGARLAAPALAMALAAGVGLGWMLQPPDFSAATASADQSSDDFFALAQFDDHYAELTP